MSALLILGDLSDIAMRLKPYFEHDGWEVGGLNRRSGRSGSQGPYDMVLCAIGRVAPVGDWFNVFNSEVRECFFASLLEPLRLVTKYRESIKPNGLVVFLTGSNPQKPMKGYLPYNAGKMGLNKMVEQLDYETPGTRFVAVAPGFVMTKIHNATLQAKWPNERLERGILLNDGTPIEKIYACLRWCFDQPKEVIGGRQLCVSDPWGPALVQRLRDDANLYKLRRVE